MAIEKKLIHFKKWSDFSSKKLSANKQNTQYTLGVDGALTTGAPDVLYQSICWIKDVKKMWTHGTLYDCSGGGGVDLSQYVTDEELANAISEFLTAEDLAKVATSGSYNDLGDKPTIPSAINIAGTNYTPSGSGIIDLNQAGLYSKPSTGIPNSDLSEELREKLNKAYINAEAYKGTVTNIIINGEAKSANDGVVDLGNLGTYSKPSTGIPKSDLNPSVQTSLGKADTAVQPGDLKDEVYIADFTIESLKDGIYNGTDVDCDVQALVNAMNANKVILVREGEDSSYKGVYVLNGYAEDLLYFSITDVNGYIYYCDGTDYIHLHGIDAQSLHMRNWDSKQDVLKSGENIKTINGESIVGSGDITIEGGGGEDIRYFTEFTVEDIVEASATNSTVLGSYSKLEIAAANNNLICIPYENADTGYVIASYSYKDYSNYSYLIVRLEYNGNLYTLQEADDDLLMVDYPINLSGGIVESQIVYAHQIEVNDNTFYSLSVEGEFSNLNVGVSNILHKGSIIRFFSSHWTESNGSVLPPSLEFYGSEVLWPNGVVPEIEIDTWYELSLTTSGDMSYCLAVLTPFKPA